MSLRIENATKGTTLVGDGRLADGIWSRMRGLIGSPPLAEGQGLLITPCSSIHTHFMGFAIDVVYVNREDQVVGIDREVAPWRFGRFHRGARYVVELPAGAAAGAGVEVGDVLRVERT